MSTYKLTPAEKATMKSLQEKGAFGLEWVGSWWRQPRSYTGGHNYDYLNEAAHALMSRRAKQQLCAEHPSWEIRQTPMGIWVVTCRRDDDDVEFAANDELAALIAAIGE